MRRWISSSLRQRILAFVCGLVVLSLLGSMVSLYRITEVSRLLDALNRVSVPLGRLFTQVQSDADLLRREMDRSLGPSHWTDPHWKARPLPRWIGEVLDSEVSRIGELLRTDGDWASADSKTRWQEWAQNVGQGLASIRLDSQRLVAALDQQDQVAASEINARLQSRVEDWRRQLQWGALEYERSFRQTFSLAQLRVTELRTGLETILAVVVTLSLLLLWLGERALRPLADLTRLAREIARRGLKKGDTALLPELPITRDDEVSTLAREFHHMAAALLEREKTVESQKARLEDQNRLLREMGALNESVLNSMRSILIVVDLDGKIARLNGPAREWLGAGGREAVCTEIDAWPMLRAIELSGAGLKQVSSHQARQARAEPRKLEPVRIGSHVYGGVVYPLQAERGGAILVLDDLTEELDLQERLRRAENLAAVGRMSAQVAHEVRNPLHSIGLEAEVAVEQAAKTGNLALKQSLQSILGSVDRLEKITENYLKLSRLSSGEKREVDLGEALESVLATYAQECESRGVKVDWRRESRAVLKVWGDRDLLEQVLGNLFRNALQALEGQDQPSVHWRLGTIESGRVLISLEDNGPGIPEEVRHRLFTPFVTSRAQGTGLGLSFVKQVIEEHGGRIDWVEPGLQPERPGTRFEIRLPSLEARPEAKPEMKPDMKNEAWLDDVPGEWPEDWEKTLHSVEVQT